MVEYLYQVDKHNKVLGKVERNFAHEKGVLHRAGMVLIFNKNNELFLTKRAKTKSYSNCYDCGCSYHIQYGETNNEALKRELFEETKLKENPIFFGDFLIDSEISIEKMFVLVYVLITDSKIVLDSKEAVDGKYYSLKEADKLISKESVIWLKKAWEVYKKVNNLFI
jgi:isopentenyl-diphosphate delta-isomerase